MSRKTPALPYNLKKPKQLCISTNSKAQTHAHTLFASKHRWLPYIGNHPNHSSFCTFCHLSPFSLLSACYCPQFLQLVPYFFLFFLPFAKLLFYFFNCLYSTLSSFLFSPSSVFSLSPCPVLLPFKCDSPLFSFLFSNHQQRKCKSNSAPYCFL